MSGRPPRGSPLPESPDVYKHLQDLRYIRLASILPGTWGDPLHCRLSYHSLDDEPDLAYSALSYVWGSPKVTEGIFLNGQPWNVTVNLAVALHYLRDPELLVRIWIDALCINQSDLDERGAQVQLMKDIYSRAREMVVYLGDGRNHRPQKGFSRQPQADKLIFHGDARDASYMDRFWDSCATDCRRWGSSRAFLMFCLIRILSGLGDAPGGTHRLTKVDARNMTALMEEARMMLLSPWWRRVWVVQEMAVSSRPIVRYGNIQAPWDMFVAAARNPWVQESSKPIVDSDDMKVLHLFSRLVQDSERVRQQWKMQDGADLLSLLQDFSSRQATDERDKVYALLSLVQPDQADLVRPSYHVDVPEVYEHTAMRLISGVGKLSLWCGDMARKNRRDLPSWVPDWSAIYEESDRRRARHESLYNVSGDWQLSVVGSAPGYWSFIEENMSLLLEDVESAAGSKELPSCVFDLLEKYSIQLAQHKDKCEAAAPMLEKILKYHYSDGSRDWSYLSGGEMSVAYEWHRSLLELPMEQSTTTMILDALHQKLWGTAICNHKTCTGHSRHAHKHSTEDFQLKRISHMDDLFAKALVQYRSYLDLAREYFEQTSDTVDSIIKMCLALQAHTLPRSSAPSAACITRVFKHSAACYGKLSWSHAVATFASHRGSHEKAPVGFWMSELGSTPLFARFKRMQEINSVLAENNLVPTENKMPVTDGSTGGQSFPRSILSIEAKFLGEVKRVFGPKMLAWSDPTLARGILRSWLISGAGWRPRVTPLSLAKTLVADACKRTEAWRLQSRHHEGLLGWFHDSLLPWLGLAWVGEQESSLQPYHGDDGLVRPIGEYAEIPPPPEAEDGFSWAGLDEAMVLATEGKVLFETHDGLPGLGPASMTPGDDICTLPGGRTHFVLRQLTGDAEPIAQRSYSLIGDCFVDMSQSQTPDGAVWRGSLPAEMLYASYGGRGSLDPSFSRVFLF